MATILGLVWSMSILGFLYSDTLGIPPFVQPVRSCMFSYISIFISKLLLVFSREIYFKTINYQFFIVKKNLYLKELIAIFCRCCFMRYWHYSYLIPPRLCDTRRDSGHYAFWVESSAHHSFMWASRISGWLINSILFTQSF